MNASEFHRTPVGAKVIASIGNSEHVTKVLQRRGMLALFNAIRTSGRAGIRRPMARHDNWTWLNDNFENMILHKQTKGLIFRVVKELQEAAGK